MTEPTPAADAKPATPDVEAVEAAVDAQVVQEEEAERSATSEKGDGPAQAGA